MKKSENKYIVGIPLPLFSYLMQGNLEGKTSRSEALYYLLKKQTSLMDLDYDAGRESPFKVSAVKLSRLWKWDRRTVKSFLFDLEKMGVAVLEKIPYGYLIRMLDIERQE